MNTPPLILFPGAAKWRLGNTDIAVEPGGSVETIAAAVAAALKENGYHGEGILLAVPSEWCLCASIETAGIPARNRMQAMTYRLEEKLPLAAEDVIADFIPAVANTAEAFGVCVEKQKLSPLVEALESAGVSITAICPAALLALQSMSPAMATANAVVLPTINGDSLDLFLMRDGKVHAWYLLGKNPRELLRHLMVEFHQKQTAVTIIVAGICDESRAALSAFHVIDAATADPAAAALSLVSPILSGKISPWIDFRRGGLGGADPLRQIRAPLSFAMASIAACVLCLCGTMLWRANQYDQLADRHANQQQDVFRQAFPNDAAPIDVLSRLTAEQRRLHGLGGDASTPAQQNGLINLRELITHLPSADELRYRVLELRLDQNQFTLEGQTAGHGDADAIAGSLRKGGLFKVDSPKTEQLGDAADANDKTVTFTITGSIVESTDSRRPAQ